MNILIAYASKTGTAADCAKRLKEELSGQNVTLADLERETPDLAGYDVVVLGSSVRFGKARPKFREYLKAKGEELMGMSHGFFLCCGFGHEFERYAEKAFDGELGKTAFATLNFGGLLKLPRASFAEKVFLHWVRSDIRETEIEDGEYTPTLPSVLPENISMMASFVRREMSLQRKNQ